MADTNQTQTSRTPKALWEVSKLMMKLASNVYADRHIAHSYKIRITKLEQERDAKLAEKKEARDELVGKIFSFVKSRKNEIIPGTKSVTLATGQVGFRQMKPAVEIASGYTVREVIAKFLKRHKKYLRFTPELNKQKLLQDYHDGKFRTLSGIKIRDGEEEFFISLAPRGKDKPETITVPLD